MDPIFTRHLRYVRLREGANRLLHQLAQTLLVAAVPALAAILLERIFAIAILTEEALLIGGGVAAAATIGRFLLTGASDARIALLIDERLAFRERFSTSLAFAASDDPFACAARAEAYAAASHLNLRSRFPLRLTRPWIHASGLWFLTFLTFAFMPEVDLLGCEEERVRIEAEKQALAEATRAVTEVSAQVQKMLEDLQAPELARKLADVTPPDGPQTPSQIRRDALRKLGEIADKLAEMAKSEEAETAKALRALMKKLKSPRGGPGRDFSRALARGDLEEAEEILKRLRRALEQGTLADAEKQELQEALKDIAAQLEALADNAAKDLEEELAAAGLDAGLARLNERELAEALRKAGLAEEKTAVLMKKARSLRNASMRSRSLGKGCRGCAGQGEGEGFALDALLSSAAAEELGAELARQRELMEELARLEAAGQYLEGRCQALGEGTGPGITGPWEPGESYVRGPNSGGPGRGGAPVDIERSSPTGAKSSRVENKGKGGQPIATWLTKDEQLAGEARRTLAQTVHAAKDSAAEAIRDNRIPAKYRNAVTQYFEELPESAPPPPPAKE